MNQGVIVGSEIAQVSLNIHAQPIRLSVNTNSTFLTVKGHLLLDHDFMDSDGHHDQEEDLLGENMRVEFVGPGSKLYRNYHTGLNARRCDANGHFLLDDALPLLRAQKSPDDWSPYHNRLEFELADFLFTQVEMPVKKIDALLEIWAASLLGLHGEPLFTNHAELYQVIDSTCVGEVQWENFMVWYTRNGQDNDQDGDMKDDASPWKFATYDVWYWDPRQVIYNILASSGFTSEMDYVPYREYNTTNNQRHWEDFMSGDWAWETANRIVSDNLMTARATLVPIILGSDKMTVSVATGQMDYYPLYLSIGNVRNTVRRVHRNAVVLIGFLAMPKTMREHASTPAFRKFKRQLYHSSLSCILESLRPAMKVPETVLFGDNYYCNLDADALRRHREHADMVIEAYELGELQEKYGLVGDLIPFTNDFPRADIHQMLSPNILHQLIKGGFKDHLVDWVEKYLIHIHGKTEAERILDDID
ncbi:hypothetical protein SCLCIDRAFT_32080 [Scleroderma citrinum Foug A]|uniref:Uncharacterized protein n=1 Tax=Scleroderma citrinum Foug A TaxID=1036808 RepID=A0A0C3CXD8_9AGAM|nr:hypothetical protein SCLCIDRAFT_32080 [Scleroderma citrinum Foug A]